MHFPLVLCLAGITFATNSDSATVIAEAPEVTTKALSDFLFSRMFDPKEFMDMWHQFYSQNAAVRTTNPDFWVSRLDTILVASIASNSTLALRTLLDISTHDASDEYVFNPNRALYVVAKSHKVNELEAARMAHLLVEYGAAPMLTGLTSNPEFSSLTVVEIAIRRGKPLVLEAFLEAPSPISQEVLEEMAESSPTARRGIEVYRTKIAREIMDLVRRDRMERIISVRGGKSEVSRAKGQRMLEVLREAGMFVFAQQYLTMLSLLIFYLTVVLMFGIVLFNLRVKRVPNPELLMTTRSGGFWPSSVVVLSTVLTSSPVSSIFETAAFAIVTVGSFIWSLLWTGRQDVALALFLLTITQASLTSVSYLTFAPVVGGGSEEVEMERYDDENAPVERLMFYPKQSDWNRVSTKTATYMFASSVAMLLLFVVFDPELKMYLCPTVSVTDTYGFPYSLTRAVAMTWDVVIYFVVALRVFRGVETVVVYDLISRFFANKETPESNDIEEDPGSLKIIG